MVNSINYQQPFTSTSSRNAARDLRICAISLSRCMVGRSLVRATIDQSGGAIDRWLRERAIVQQRSATQRNAIDP